MDSAIHGAMKASGCMFGLAYGDALGKPTEFLNYDQIIDRYGPAGPRNLAGNPCLATGASWIAEEALATALHCFLLYPDPEQVVAMLGRGAGTSGDSDSIASIAGAFAGAAHGFAAWPTDWADQIEYHIELRRIGSSWD